MNLSLIPWRRRARNFGLAVLGCLSIAGCSDDGQFANGEFDYAESELRFSFERSWTGRPWGTASSQGGSLEDVATDSIIYSDCSGSGVSLEDTENFFSLQLSDADRQAISDRGYTCSVETKVVLNADPNPKGRNESVAFVQANTCFWDVSSRVPDFIDDYHKMAEKPAHTPVSLRPPGLNPDDHCVEACVGEYHFRDTHEYCGNTAIADRQVHELASAPLAPEALETLLWTKFESRVFISCSDMWDEPRGSATVAIPELVCRP